MYTLKDVNKAKEFAKQAHGDQMYGEASYVSHLDQVASLVKPYGYTTQIIAYLHDTIEDTDITENDIAAEFDDFVALCVSLITDPNDPGLNRKSRKEAVNAVLKGLPDTYNDAILVKVADRLANIRNGAKNDMYRKEHPDFFHAAYRPGLCDNFWMDILRILHEQ